MWKRKAKWRNIIIVVTLLVVLSSVALAATQPSGQAAESKTVPVPDMQSLLNFSKYDVNIKEITDPAQKDMARRKVLEQPETQALMREFQGKGHSPQFSGPSFFDVFFDVEIVQLELKSKASLLIGEIPFCIDPDGVTGKIVVGLDRNRPERSTFMGHLTNVYNLQPEEMRNITGNLSFNAEPMFIVHVAQVVRPTLKVIWYRYWWYDSHHHKNWWYGAYWWYWWYYRWNGYSWWWWYDWWWGWYHWRYWWSWSTLWPPFIIEPLRR